MANSLCIVYECSFFSLFANLQVKFNRILCMTILGHLVVEPAPVHHGSHRHKARKDPIRPATQEIQRTAERIPWDAAPRMYTASSSRYSCRTPPSSSSASSSSSSTTSSATRTCFSRARTRWSYFCCCIASWWYRPRREPQSSEEDSEYMMSESSSRARLMVHSTSTDQYYNYRTKVNLREPEDDPDEPPVAYVVNVTWVTAIYVRRRRQYVTSR